MTAASRYILTTDGNVYLVPANVELYHHGVKGMKWGVRRYQNKDGSLTAAGKKRAAKLEEKLNDNRSEARARYRLASAHASEARTAKESRDRKSNKYYGIKQMDKAYDLDKKITKIEKKMKDIGMNPAKDQELVAARTQAGKDYVKRSAGARVADVVGETVVNAGALAAQAMLGSPLLMVYFPTPNKHKLK